MVPGLCVLFFVFVGLINFIYCSSSNKGMNLSDNMSYAYDYTPKICMTLVEWESIRDLWLIFGLFIGFCYGVGVCYIAYKLKYESKMK